MTFKSFMDRYAPTVAVLVSLVLLSLFVVGERDAGRPVRTGNVSAADGGADGDAATTPEQEAAAAEQAAATEAEAAAAAAAASNPTASGGLAGPTASGAQLAALPGSGTPGVRFGVGPNCRPDGRQNQIWLYAPVCVEPWVKGTDNGGATARGVTRDKVVVVRYIMQSDPATQAALRGIGAEDLPEDQKRIYEVLRQYMNSHTETYGREVAFVDVNASGPNDDDASMKADAVKIANEIKAFAVFNGSTVAPVLASELAQRGVPCICIRSQSKGFYKANPSLIFGDLPTLEDYYESLAEYIGKRLANRPAKWAGDPTGVMQRTNRKFGLIWVEGEKSKADPDYRRAKDYFIRELGRYGVELSADVGYLYRIEAAGEQSTGMIARMKNAGVSNLLMMGDPLYPIFITQEATRQGYFPEWLISGTLLSDTSFFGRTYDKQQWRHAFGMSPLWVFFEDVKNSYGYRIYHHMRPGSQPGDEGVGINVYTSPVQQLFNGIQMAGPRLTPESFAEALFRAPAIGGKPAAPLVKYTKESPNAIKDFVEVFWDESGRGKDETGKDGVGVILKANGGRRYVPGQWPASEPNVFQREGALFTSDNPPGGLDTFPHDKDGHRHDPKVRCMSC